jgi:RNA polymerase sigma-70 factor (ECF subfamily)
MSTVVHQLGKRARTTPDCAVDEAARNSHLSRLVTRIADGDRSAFAELFDATSERLIAAMRSRLRDVDQAVEVANETFVEMWWMARHHLNGDGDNAAAAWMVDIAVRRAEDRMHPGRTAHDAPDADPSISPDLVAEIHGQGTNLMLARLLGRP